MAVSVGEWEKEWKRAKKDFEAKSDKKKPSKTFLGFRIGSGVEGAFKKMDEAFKDVREAQGPDKAKKVAPFRKAVKAAEKAVEDYCKDLDKAAAKEADGSDQLALLKILKKDAKACLSQAEGQAVIFETAVKSDGNMDPKAMRSAKVLRAVLAGTLKKASLWIAERARDKSVAEFNSGIQTAARDITQNLANLAKLYDGTPDGKEIHKCQVPLEAWGNKGRKLADDADEKALLTELKMFHEMVKRTGAWLKSSPEPK